MKLAPFVAIVLGIIPIISVWSPTLLFPKPASAYYSSIESEIIGLYGPPKASIIPVQVNLTVAVNTPCEPFSSSISHTKLRNWPLLNFTAKAIIDDALRDFDSSLQLIEEDSFKDVKYDQFSVTVDRMPMGLTPEEYLSEMANNMNKAVDDTDFNKINVFHKVSEGTPSVGTIYNIDMAGPDNGSVIIVDKSSTSFTVQTITTPLTQTTTGNHPESGAREFGFIHNNDGSVTFYTNGVSQADIGAFDFLGKYLQGIGWDAAMKGISNEMNNRGGSSDPSTTNAIMCQQDERSSSGSPGSSTTQLSPLDAPSTTQLSPLDAPSTTQIGPLDAPSTTQIGP